MPPAPEPAVVSRPVPLPSAPASGEAGDGPVQVELQFVGVGDLHQRWFSDRAIATRLAEGLTPCVRERAVVRMTWDDATFAGSIRLYVDQRSLTCHPERSDAAVDLAPFAPIARSLAAYRDAVANSFDLRVASFKVELEALDGTRLCRLTLGGQFPPDGSTWSPCVDLGGRTVCAGPREPGLTSFGFEDPADTRYLAGCLGR